MSSANRSTVGKTEQWARWTLWPTLILTVACLAMRYTGASDRTWQWFLPVYLLVGMPIIVGSFVSDFTGLRDIWRSWKDGGDDPL